MTTDERVQAIADYGFTERQARFLVLVMRHSGLCVKSRSTEIDLIEPPQRHHFSSTWRRLRVLMKNGDAETI